LGMICAHNFTAILLIVAYVIVGFKSNDLIPSLLPLILLILLYTPVALLIIKALRPRRKDEMQGVTSQA